MPNAQYILNQSEILKPETYIAPNGILTVKPQTVVPVTPNLTIVPILQTKDINGLLENPYTDIPKPVRSASIPDSVWQRMVNDYNNQVIARQQLSDSQNAAIIEQNRLNQQAADQKAAAERQAVIDKQIHDQQLADQEAEKAKLDEVSAAMQDVFRTMDEADKAKQKLDAAGINADATTIHEAAVTAVAQAVAVNNAADAGANLPVGMQTESAEKAANLVSDAAEKGFQLPNYIALPDNTVITQNEVAKVVNKLIVEGTEVNKAATGKTQEAKNINASTATKYLNWFDRFVEYIYVKLYK
jgi:hypothetical protein